ncbi:MAG TPA: DUF5362 family protein [Hanamia sp.]
MEHLDLLNNDLQVSQASQSFLGEAVRWGKFLSIVGFISCGLLAIVSFFAPKLYSSMPAYQSLTSGTARGVSVVISVIYLCSAVVLFFPSLYLNKFSTKMKVALNSSNQEDFDESLQNLKSLLKFYGIFIIIMLSLFVLLFILSMLGLAMAS